jgi:transposase InsO family protein
MGMGRYVVDAVLLEGRSAREVARAHGISKSWIYELIRRYRAGGYEALEPRSRRPRSCNHETSAEVVEAIVELRGELEALGHDAGAETIAYHLAQQGKEIPSVSTIWRILRREGLVAPEPQKRPRSSLIRFEADLPNEMWQADITAWRLACGEVVEVLNLIDDHSRLFLGSDAYPRVKAADVVSSFHKAAELHGLPASLLSDNGAVFTGSYRGGKVLLEYELERLGVQFKNSRPYHPQTCGKVERLHQTLKRYLAKQPPGAHAYRAPGVARCLCALLQPHPPAQSPSRANPSTGLQRAREGEARGRLGRHLLPRAPGQSRQDREGQPAL